MLLLLLACSHIDVPNIEDRVFDSGEDTGVEDTGIEEDTSGEDTGVEDTGKDTALDTSGDTSTGDTASDTADEDTGVEDTGVEDTGVEDTAEDTAPPPCTGLVFDTYSVAFVARGAYDEYITNSYTFHVTGCATNVIALSGCSSGGSSWWDVSWPGDSAPAAAGSMCSLTARYEPLLDDSGVLVDGEVDTEVTLTATSFGFIDPVTWGASTVASDQGTTTIVVNFD